MNNNNDGFNNSKNQLTISYNLLALLRWMAQYERPRLKKIIITALKDGLQQELNVLSIMKDDPELSEDLHTGVLDIFELLETLLGESLKEQAVERAREKKLLPSAEQIDSSICDNSLVQSSIEKTTAKVDLNPELNPQEQLFKEILKRWRPDNKNLLN